MSKNYSWNKADKTLNWMPDHTPIDIMVKENGPMEFKVLTRTHALGKDLMFSTSGQRRRQTINQAIKGLRRLIIKTQQKYASDKRRGPPIPQAS